MRKIFKTVVIIFILALSFSIKTQAEEITDINTLIEKAKEMDGKEVMVQGEVSGESMNRGNYSWVNINDGTNAIGIWLKNSEVKQILHYGNYKYKGDIVRISGIISRACKEHGGEADIHSMDITIVEKGYKANRQLSTEKIVVAIILSAASIILFMYLRRVIKKQ